MTRLAAEQPAHLAGVGPGHVGLAPETALPGGRLLLQQVVLEGAAALQLAGPGHLEALGGAPVGLHLRHLVSPRSLLSWRPMPPSRRAPRPSRPAPPRHRARPPPAPPLPHRARAGWAAPAPGDRRPA